MTNVIKSYNITYYWNASSSVTVASNSPHVTLSSLKSGSNYTITVVTVGARGYLSTPVSGSVFTNPTPPRNISFILIQTNTTTLSWVEPVNMTRVIKSYNIAYYWNASSPITVTSNYQNVTLLSLKSGSNYTITVVTVGARGYLSTPVSGSVFTKS
ncbi:hypothetical protein AB205_0059140 [Aquarana catesbeiana]|uniref:Fibronectin type-III domain-containing protein n=1 Tax=Aquarana catesbeiana TaxID=8400 RepID=A0A2G9R3I6_AQUCT|nr:hypothetical protein AB205_0059140 [Aquarana catesbeiana]